MAGTRDDSPEAKRVRAEKAFHKQEERQAQASEREREETARVAGIDEKTARLKALRLARDAEEGAAPKVKKR